MIPGAFRQEITQLKNSASAGETAPLAGSDELRKIIANAIGNEMAESVFYANAAESVKDTALRTLFKDFAREKLGHRDFLENYMAMDRGAMQSGMAKDYKVTDAFRTPELTPDMKPLDGMVLAIRRERESAATYRQLGDATMDAGQKTLYMDLVSLAQFRKSRLEDIYTNMAFPEAW